MAHTVSGTKEAAKEKRRLPGQRGWWPPAKRRSVPCTILDRTPVSAPYRSPRPRI